MQTDIVSTQRPKEFVVTGFFTPDYRPLAERLAEELEPIHPYHFFFRAKGKAAWHEIVRWKPDVVLGAMSVYPDTTIILLDVDCSVRGRMHPMIDFAGDVSALPSIKVKGLWPFRRFFLMHISSRCMVFKPTQCTRSFVQAWREECEDKRGLYVGTGDEMALLVALMGTPGLSFCRLDARYSGRQGASIPPGAVIVHSSFSRGFQPVSRSLEPNLVS